MISLETLPFLTSPAGTALLTALAAEDLRADNSLPLITRLRKTYAAADAAAALELARLRLAAVPKFGADAAGMYFTRDALEQASDPLARAYRAAQLDARTLVDAGCGIGADALAFAAAGLAVTGIDRDPLRVALAQVNAAALGLAAQFQIGDVTHGLPAADAVFFDPARRTADGRRLHHVEAYQPPLSTLRAWGAPTIMVKLSPAVALDQVTGYGGRLTFVSVGGDLKEALLHLTTPADPPSLRAVLLTEAGALSWDADDAELPPTLADPGAWLIEPDPALIRAGRVRAAAAAWGAAQLDETIAYVTADAAPPTPWARAWPVITWLPFNVNGLRAALRAHGIGRVTVKQRGWSGTPEALISALKLKGAGTAEGVVVVTRRAGRLIAIVCGAYQPVR